MDAQAHGREPFTFYWTPPLIQLNHVRRLAVYVDESEPDQYYWLLHEALAGSMVWADFKEGELSFATWREAYDAGTIALMKTVEDQHFGPR